MINADLPITNSSEDILNRGSFARGLAQTITKQSFPASFTIGLYGAWGSGKTSLLNMILENIKNNDNTAVILRFNPWLCADPKQLINQFFKQLASAIKLNKPKSEKVWELIDQYADLFEATSAIPYIGAFTAAIGEVLGKKAKDRVSQRSGDLQESKDQIVKKLSELDTKIVVSIDDIDRLSENEIIAVFQLVKVLADFPNTIYLLAFDYDVVIRALSKVQQGDGKEYLEKIIQVPFEIPAPNLTSIHNTLFSKLETIMSDVPEERWAKAVWADCYRYGFQKYIKSIRDVIRFTNVFTLKYELLKDETDPVDLLGLTLLQVFEPLIYSRIPHYKELLCGTGNNYSYERQKEDEEKIKKALSIIVPKDDTVMDSEAAKTTLGILFPRIKAAAGISFSIGRNYSKRDFLINKNIAAPECFDRYFALVLENDAIPAAIIKDLIYESIESAFEEGILQLYRAGKIVRFLEETEAYAKRADQKAVPVERAALIIRVLCRNWGKFEVDDRGMLGIPFNWRFQNCVNHLLKRMDLTSRLDCINAVFHDEEVQPSTLAMLLSDFEKQHGRFTESNSQEGDALVPPDTLYELEKVFKNRAVDAIESGKVFNQYQGLNFLWLLGLIDSALLASIKKIIIKNDSILAKVINYCASRGTAVTNTVIKTRYVNFERVNEFIDVDEAYRRICDYIKTEEFFLLPEDDQMSAMAFKLLKEGADSESVSEKFISEEVIKKTLELMRG